MSGPVLVTKIDGLRALLAQRRAEGAAVSFVPTMGALHAGHASLLAVAARAAPVSVASVFVNPLQFGPNEDFGRYPRALERDRQILAEAGTSILFAPDSEEMLPPREHTRVIVGTLSETLCGPHRPGHFEGVATIVNKLFSIVGPCKAFFGRKDYQQLKIIQAMVRDLFMAVEVIGLPTVREADGLAMSSRNAYLSPSDRERATALSRGLQAAWHLFRAGERSAGALREAADRALRSRVDSVDYISVADPEDLSEVPDAREIGERALVAVAVRIGKTRLIDNLVLGEDPAIQYSAG